MRAHVCKPWDSSAHAINMLSVFSATEVVHYKCNVIFDEHAVPGPAVHESRGIHNLQKLLDKSTDNILTPVVKHFSVKIKL